MKFTLNTVEKKNVVLPSPRRHCSQFLTVLFSIVTPESDSTILFTIVDNYEQCGQHKSLKSLLLKYLNRQVKSVLRIDCAHNKGRPSDFKHCRNSTFLGLFLN